MSSLDAEDFAAFYAAVHDYPPLPWQQALAEDLLNEGAWPDAVDVATGLGKTSLIDIALFAAAAGAPAARRRTFFVVDRRLVVDEAHDHARKLARALATPAGRPAIVGRMARALRQPADEGPVVEVARMRGGTTWSWRWVERPDRHAVVVGTVDQIGSRLLMRGYGLSANLAPIDAALVGTDSLILCDEAHLSQTLLTTLASAAAGEGAAGRLSGPVVVPLSATVPLKPGARVHTTTAADASHPMAGGRLRAPRRLHLVVPKATKAKAARVVPAQMAGWAHALAGSADSGRVVLTVCNTVARARAVFDQLTDLGVAAEDRVLLTGRSRPLDRDHVLATAYPRMHLDQRPHGPGRPFHVVATQTVEVGANIDADALVSESASLTALVQRLGRLGRAPEHRTGVSVFRAVVVHDPATTEDDPVYGAARNATWELLSRHAPPAERTAAAPFALEKLGPSMAASPVALRALQDQLSPDQRHALAGSAPTAPYLWQTTLEAWTNTAPRPHPDPPVAPYLHGLTTRKSDVQVLWRADITEADLQGTVGQDVLERLQALPPATEEMLPLPITALRRWAAGASPSGIADVEGTTEHREEAPTAELRVLRYRGRNDITALPLTRVQPGDVIVLPSTYGGCDAYGWAPEDTRPVTDVADLAPRRRPQIRLHPRLLDFLAPDPESAPDQTGDADPLRSVVAALLRAVAEHDPEAPPQAEDFTTALRALPQAEEPAGPATRRHRLATVLAQLADPRRLRAAPAPPDAEATPTVVLSLGSGAVSGDDDTASSSAGDAPLGLEEHQQDVARQAADFARNLGLADREVAAVWLAGRYHDEGKRDPRFQAMLHGLPTKALAGRPVLAKSRLNPADPAAYRQALRRSGYPPGMRHEALSARIAAHHLDQERYDVDRELVLHLIVAHHGRARPLIPAVRDPDPVTVAIPGTTTAVSTAELADWHQPARFEDLNTCYGPWKLALLEAVVRMADIWCSAGHPVTTTAHPRLNRTARPPPPRPGPASAHSVELPARVGREQLRPQHLQAAGEQPGDVHLGDADPGCDLVLGQVADEAQVQDAPLARRQRRHRWRHHHPQLGQQQPGVLGAQQVAEGGAGFASGLPGRCVQRRRLVGAADLQAFADLILRDVEIHGEFGDAGRMAQLLGQPGGGLSDGQPQFLQPTGDAQVPRLVAEVAADFADDGRYGEGDEVAAPVDVEPVDCLDEADRGGLDQVLDWLPPAGEPPCQVGGEW